MLARVTEPGLYQAFQHFITHAPWSADRVWRRLRATLPVREGMLIIDATTFLKQGQDSVGVARQYSGLQGQIVNCQAAVTAALWSEGRAFLVGAALYLPQSWVTDAARARGHIPTTARFQEKWRLALTLLRQVRASGIRLTGVLADADFGDKRAFRGLLHRLRLPYAVGVSTHLTAFRGTPRLTGPRAWPGSHRRRLVAGVTARPIAELIASEDCTVAPCAMAQSARRSGTQRRLCRDAGHAGTRPPPAASLTRDLATRRARGRLPAQNPILLRQSASDGLTRRAGALRTSALAD